MTDTAKSSYTSFNGHERIASGSLKVNALAVKHALASDVTSPLLTFCDQTGQVVDIDIRGSDVEMLARLPPEGNRLQGNEKALINSEESGETRGRGRPKLGVVAREVTLLPRHWDWLAAQRGGASVTLRKLVDEARRANVDRDRQRQTNERAYHFMSTMAGDMAGFDHVEYLEEKVGLAMRVPVLRKLRIAMLSIPQFKMMAVECALCVRTSGNQRPARDLVTDRIYACSGFRLQILSFQRFSVCHHQSSLSQMSHGVSDGPSVSGS